MRRHDGFLCGEESPLIDAVAPPARGGPRLPVIPYPEGVERAYRSALRPMLDDLRERTAALVEGLSSYTVEDHARGPDDGEEVTDARRMSKARAAALAAKIEEMRAAVIKRWTTEQIVKRVPLEEFVQGVDRQHARAMDKQVGEAIKRSPLDLPDDAEAWVKANDGSFAEAKRDAWTRANAKLISSIAERHVDRIAEVVEAGVRAGSRASVVARRIQETTGISRRRAATIARDQVATLQGQVAAARQKKLGITSYRWRTAGDLRVRTAHRQREGRIFSWQQPPADGHPGQPINCRCTAEPVLDEVLGGLMPE